jgi:PAS domain S-box-containing protein
MSIGTNNLRIPGSMRYVAEERLRDGIPPPAHGGWTTGLDALNVLHNLAGSPERAGDALKLLHELQVHQVELAMQHEQLEQSRAEVAESLERYVERFDFAPVGYFSVEPDGTIVEGNLAGADLFGVDRAELPGRPIESLIAADSRAALGAVLNRLRKDGPTEACEVYAEPAGGPRRLLQAVAKAAPRTRFLYVTFTSIHDSAAHKGTAQDGPAQR